MARQDILIDANYGEVETADEIAGRLYCAFLLLGRIEGLDNGNYAYGEIALPAESAPGWGEGSSLHTLIPYIPLYRQLRVRLRVETPGGGTDYPVNPADNGPWYTVRRGGGEEIRLSEFGELNGEGIFRLVCRGGVLELYSGCSTDFRVGAALPQNEVFLLKAAPGTLYQHPATGVGLIDYLHGNFENTGLAARLQSEFESDGMTIDNAYMNSETGELLLDVTEKDG